MISAFPAYPGSGYESAAGSAGFSAEADIIQEQIDALNAARARAVTLDTGYRETLGDMTMIVTSRGNTDWDGEGGAGASAGSFLNARRFLEALPADLQRPDVSLDPDGEIVFEWSGGLRRAFSISFGLGGKLTYAGLFGPSTTHGVEYITHALPRELVTKIRRACSSR